MSLSDEEISDLLDSYEKQARALKEDAIRITWWMRGGIDLDSAMTLSAEEKKIIDEIVKDNMEATKKSGMPFF